MCLKSIIFEIEKSEQFHVNGLMIDENFKLKLQVKIPGIKILVKIQVKNSS